jgi:hypothetical protein
MGMKKLLILAPFLITIPLLLFINTLDNKVETPEKLNKLISNLYKCSDLPKEKRDDCYLINLNTKLSLIDNLSLIKQINKDSLSNEKIKNLCHEITHHVGSLAYLNHKDKSLISGYESCGQGYYHGIMSEIIIKKDNQKEEITNFCAQTSQNSTALGLCYHGIGHTLLNIIPTKIDKEFIDTLIKSCLDISISDKVNKITDNLATLCFTGGFEEYLKIKYIQNQNQNEIPSITNCQQVGIKFIKYCYSILFSYELVDELKNPSTEVDAIFLNFEGGCYLLPSANELDIKIKEACYTSLAKSYVNRVLTGDQDINTSSPKLLELKTEDLYKIITKICNKDFNKNCTIWFLLELNEKLIPTELDALVAKFENLSLKEVFDFVF